VRNAALGTGGTAVAAAPELGIISERDVYVAFYEAADRVKCSRVD
jgi:hypothetical protein